MRLPELLLCGAIIIFGIYGIFLGGCMENKNHSHNLHTYYTNLSNLIIIAYEAVLLLSSSFSAEIFSVLKNDVLCFALMDMILTTHLVYNFVLLPAAKRYKKALTDAEKQGGTITFNNICVHYIVPLTFTAQWFFFSGKELDFSAVLIWMLIPIFYCVYIFIRAMLKINIYGKETPYPYFFIDLPLIGKKAFLQNIFLCLLAFFILGAATFGVSLLF